jgi:hypothetical protein
MTERSLKKENFPAWQPIHENHFIVNLFDVYYRGDLVKGHDLTMTTQGVSYNLLKKELVLDVRVFKDIPPVDYWVMAATEVEATERRDITITNLLPDASESRSMVFANVVLIDHECKLTYNSTEIVNHRLIFSFEQVDTELKFTKKEE